MFRTITFLATVLLTPLHGVAARQAAVPELGSRVRITTMLRAPPAQDMRRKDPAVAGLASFFVPFGTGSFYAGNVGHGVRHLAIGGTMVAIGLVSFCLEYCTSGEETGQLVAFFGFIANWIAGTVTAVLDAHAFNRRQATAGMRLAPGVRLLGTLHTAGYAPHTAPAVGLQLGRVAF